MRLDVLRHDQADLGILEVRAVVDHFVLVLGPVFAVGDRQPGREHGVKLAGGHALPHDPGRHGHQLHVVAQFLFDDLGCHMGGRHTVGPAIDIADAHFLGHRLYGAHCQYQGGTRPQESSHFHQSFPFTSRIVTSRIVRRPTQFGPCLVLVQGAPFTPGYHHRDRISGELMAAIINPGPPRSCCVSDLETPRNDINRPVAARPAGPVGKPARTLHAKEISPGFCR